MAEYSRHDPVNGRTITDQEYEDMNAPHDPSGVIGAIGDTSIVYADGTARAVKIRANKRAKVRGRTWYNDAAEVQVTIQPNTAGAGLTRIDTIVLRLYRATQGAAPAPQAWQVRLAVVQGVASATPAAPALTQQTASGNTVWDLPLANVTVVNGATVINAGDVVSREWYVGDGYVTSAVGRTRPVGLPDGTLLIEQGTVLGKVVRRRFRWDQALNGNAGGWRIERQRWWSIVLGPGSAAGTRLPNGTSVPGSGSSFAAVYTPAAIPIEPGCEWLITYSMPLNCSVGTARFLTRLRDGASALVRAEVVQQSATSDFVRAEIVQFPWVPPVGQTNIAPIFDATELGGKTFDAYADPSSPFWLVLEATGTMAAEVQTAP